MASPSSPRRSRMRADARPQARAPGGEALAGRDAARHRRSSTAQASRIAGDIAVLTSTGVQSAVRLARRDGAAAEHRGLRGRSPTSWLAFTRAQTSRSTRSPATAQTTSDGGRGVATTCGPPWRGSTPRPAKAQLRGRREQRPGDLRRSAAAAADLRDVTDGRGPGQRGEPGARPESRPTRILSRDPAGPGHPRQAGAADSTLYSETTRTVKELQGLIADIRVNPRST